MNFLLNYPVSKLLAGVKQRSFGTEHIFRKAHSSFCSSWHRKLNFESVGKEVKKNSFEVEHIEETDVKHTIIQHRWWKIFPRRFLLNIDRWIFNPLPTFFQLSVKQISFITWHYIFTDIFGGDFKLIKILWRFFETSLSIYIHRDVSPTFFVDVVESFCFTERASVTLHEKRRWKSRFGQCSPKKTSWNLPFCSARKSVKPKYSRIVKNEST